MTTSRRGVTTTAMCSGLVLLSVLVTGCSGDDGSPETAAQGTAQATTQDTVTPATAPAGPATVEWVDGVCSASAALRSSLQQVRGALGTDSGTSETAAQQGRQEAARQVAAVQQDVADLRTAVTTVPPGAESQVEAAKERLLNHTAQVEETMTALRSSADELRESETSTEVQSALRAFAGHLAAAQQTLQAYQASLEQAATNEQQRLQAAFAAAPACLQLTPTTAMTTL